MLFSTEIHSALLFGSLLTASSSNSILLLKDYYGNAHENELSMRFLAGMVSVGNFIHFGAFAAYAWMRSQPRFKKRTGLPTTACFLLSTWYLASWVCSLIAARDLVTSSRGSGSPYLFGIAPLAAWGLIGSIVPAFLAVMFFIRRDQQPALPKTTQPTASTSGASVNEIDLGVSCLFYCCCYSPPTASYIDRDAQLVQKLERWSYVEDRNIKNNKCKTIGCAICTYRFGFIAPIGCISCCVHRNGSANSAQKCLSKLACCKSMFTTVLLVTIFLVFMLHVKPVII